MIVAGRGVGTLKELSVIYKSEEEKRVALEITLERKKITTRAEI